MKRDKSDVACLGSWHLKKEERIGEKRGGDRQRSSSAHEEEKGKSGLERTPIQISSFQEQHTPRNEDLPSSRRKKDSIPALA